MMRARSSRRLAWLAAIGVVVSALTVPGGASSAQSQSALELTGAVRRALERLPYYGVFDFMAFDVERGTVTLSGYAYHGSLRHAAEAAARQAAGVEEVANRLELLPVSPDDDRIRWATFYTIYTDAFLSRYAPGGSDRVRRAVYDARRTPGAHQPLGLYAIHIVVRGRRTTLFGLVDSDADRQVAGMRARGVPGVISVANEIAIASDERRAAR